ncbi:MAG: hypothetical protein IJX76_07275 [Clostridia bacterium]|nr:hypothetical protein [Clostridia bacterium]
MHKTNRLFHGRKWIALGAVMIMMLTLFSLPLQAASPYRRDDRGIMGDIRDGVRRFGRDVSDAIDPDGDGVLPDGSIDDGMTNDGNQNTPDNGGILPGVTSDGTVTTPDTPAETGDDPTPGTDDGNRTDEAIPGTTAPTTTATTTTAPTTDNGASDTVEDQEGGFRWTGLIIGLVIAAAVVLIIILLVPKKKH